MTKARSSDKFINTIDECLSNGVKNGIFQVTLEDDVLNGRQVTIEGRQVVNFGSCSYLGLEVDDRLKNGAIDAAVRYGTQYSSSRLFSSCNLYEEIEDLFFKIFDNNPSILAATTTLAHLGSLPILVHEEDLIILDHQVHGSVQLAVQVLKARGTKVEMIKHNRMDMLEDIIKQNPNKYNKIWYMADGLYSMYGDFAPLQDITFLMEKYPNFYVYMDDAHGMSWTGKHGSGYVLSQMKLHPKMVLSTSLAKGFGTGGGITVVTDPELRRKIVTCGSSYTYSGPVQPPMLGASIASAKIHLSDEIYELQNKLAAKIALTRNLIEQYELPLVLPSNSPIFYIGLGLPRVGYNMVKRLLKEGFYTNIGIFPGVPVKCCGLRLAVTNGQTDEDIKSVLEAFKYHFQSTLEEEGQTVEDISTNFNLPFEKTAKRYPISANGTLINKFDIQHETSITGIDKVTWDNLMGESTYDWEGCKFMEDTFQGNKEPENNWQMHYLIIRDHNKKPVVATLFSELICKDDMIASSAVSEQIEEIRKKDRYYLSSKVIMMGSLITEGNHIFIDRTHSGWREAMLEMIRIMNDVKQKCGASMLQLRDLPSLDTEIQDFLIKEGFIKIEMPETHILLNADKWSSEEEYMQNLTSSYRWGFRRKVLANKHFFNVNVLTGTQKADKSRVDLWYSLYLNVKGKSFNINTYELPRKYFENIVSNPSWEVIELRLKPEHAPAGGEAERLVALGFCYKSAQNNYGIALVGLDYTYVVSHGCYRQTLYQSIVRANKLKCHKHYMGMDAAIEKQRFGVQVIPKSVYVQANDNFNMELIGTVYNKK
ncbi:aminotransferase class I/II-fold pyridoxal phosphate-dependent enzyme [Chryseosolibacter indicus]|uniref:Aminotransferase class I/II-fold pyridoxal phosphate-dependent enzyme n=1 Tax=Chryseosolibacter indicus TaxID=2782351 RepID=A0ABS5VSY7_9BACT|nr:aminotransferase class I/II-fold pyridoxal phosphate-dependent enzyme [Chryseosolibacter indicus]MBT1703955.1 aminotransferase class I/II-fold pyridoxal phosphate-dependent enzyme [Chryseosolibacter indicus]